MNHFAMLSDPGLFSDRPGLLKMSTPSASIRRCLGNMIAPIIANETYINNVARASVWDKVSVGDVVLYCFADDITRAGHILKHACFTVEGVQCVMSLVRPLIYQKSEAERVSLHTYAGHAEWTNTGSIIGQTIWTNVSSPPVRVLHPSHLKPRWD